MNDYLELLFGVLLAFIGGELFVKGTVGLAHWVRISPGVIGVTVAAFATSSPELSVSITSALAGTPQIALGDALGSNIFNGLFIIVPIAAIIHPIDIIWQDVAFTLLFGMVAILLIFPTGNGFLNKKRGVALLLLYMLYTGIITQFRMS